MSLCSTCFNIARKKNDGNSLSPLFDVYYYFYPLVYGNTCGMHGVYQNETFGSIEARKSTSLCCYFVNTGKVNNIKEREGARLSEKVKEKKKEITSKVSFSRIK